MCATVTRVQSVIGNDQQPTQLYDVFKVQDFGALVLECFISRYMDFVWLFIFLIEFAYI